MKDFKIIYYMECGFIAGPPVYGSNFFGRKEILKRLEYSLNHNRSVLLIGERRIGKSSILTHANFLIENKTWLKDKPIMIRMDGFRIDPHERENNRLAIYLVEKVIRGLLEWATNKPISIKKNIQEVFKSKDLYESLSECLWNIREENFHLVILFDEIDCAILDGSEKIAGVLRSITQSGHIAALVTSYRNIVDIQIENHFSSPWWNSFQIEYIGLFATDEAFELLSTLSRNSGRQFSTAESNFLIDVFGNYPYYLQQAGIDIFMGSDFLSCPENKRTSYIKAVIEKTIQQLVSLYAYMVENLTEPEIEILHKTIKGVRIKPNSITDNLMKRGLIVEKDKGLFQIYSLSFEEFIKALPESSLLEKASTSKTLQTLLSVAGKALAIATTKALDIAAQKFF